MIVLCIVVGWRRGTKGDLGRFIHPGHVVWCFVVRMGGERGVFRHVLSFPVPLKPAEEGMEMMKGGVRKSLYYQ